MGWLEGLLTGYNDTMGDIRREHAAEAERSAQREGKVYEALLNSPDHEIRAMAATGLIQGTQPRRLKSGKSGMQGWFGEMQGSPIYPTLMKYISTPQAKTTESYGLPSRDTTKGYLPQAPGHEPTLAQSTGSPTEGDALATPQPLPQPPPTVATPPPEPPSLTPEEASINFNASPNLTPPPRLTDEEAALNFSNLGASTQATAPPPPPYQFTQPGEVALSMTGQIPPQAAPPAPPAAAEAAPPGAAGAPTPPPTPPANMLTAATGHYQEGPRTTTTSYELPHVFQTEGDRAIALRRAQGEGDFEALVEVGQRSGQPNPQKWAADLIAQGYSRGSLAEGTSRQLPDGTWVQDLYDKTTGRIISTIPSSPPASANRQYGTREEIAASMYGKPGEDPIAVNRRLSPAQRQSVLDEEIIRDAEKKVKQAEMMANAPLTAVAKSDLIEKLNTKWTGLEKPQRIMAQAVSKMNVGVQGLDRDPASAGQAILVTFQQILDPTSVVREGEYARSVEGQPVVQRVQAGYDRLTKGGVGVPKEELIQMAETARQFLVGLQTFNSGEHQRIVDRARQNNIDPGYIFGGGLQNPPPAPPATGASQVAAPAAAAPAAAPAHTPPAQPGAGPGLIMRNGVLSYPDGRPF